MKIRLACKDGYISAATLNGEQFTDVQRIELDAYSRSDWESGILGLHLYLGKPNEPGDEPGAYFCFAVIDAEIVLDVPDREVERQIHRYHEELAVMDRTLPLMIEGKK